VGLGSGNSRNGTSSETILTEDGEIAIAILRDRTGSFELQLIAKGQTLFDDFDDKILSLYARGMTVREIQGHLSELYGTDGIELTDAMGQFAIQFGARFPGSAR
jgi:transposase-like protein